MRILILFSLFLISLSANAHLAGITDTHIELGKSKLKVVYTVPNIDLRLLASEVDITKGIKIYNAQQTCTAIATGGKQLENIASQQFFIDYHCPQDLSDLRIEYDLLFNAKHQNHVRLSIAGRLQDFTFSADKTHHEIPVNYLLALWHTQLSDNNFAPTTPSNIIDQLISSTPYFGIGIEHIVLGWDHVLFLLCLLLLPIKLKQLMALVTSFTLAHSITLALSVLNIISLPALMVEILIAFSIVYVALHNLWTLRQQRCFTNFTFPLQRQLLTTFGFGLIHGFGFSYILKEMGLGEQASAALLFFNLGVETGQLMVVAIAFPALVWIFKQQNSIVFAQAMSCIVGTVGVFWLAQRTGLI